MSTHDKRPKLLIVASTNRRRGAEVVTERLRDGLTDRGWQVDAVSLTSAPSGATADIEPLTGVDPSDLGRLRLAALASLRRRIKEFDPDVVLANGGPTLRYAVLAGVGHRSRLAYVAIGEPLYWIRSQTSRRVNRALLRRTDSILAVCQLSMDQLIEIEPSVRGRISVAHTGVPADLFRIGQAQSKGPLRVVMVGSLSGEKDPMTALRSVAGVPGASLRFVGAGPLASGLREEANHLGIAGRVELVGSVEDVGPHLEWAHLLVLTSTTEGLPGAILEAGAAGLPVVAVDVGGVKEAVVDGETGLLVPRGDQSAIEAALRALDEDRELVDRMGAAARRHIAKNFDLDRAIDRYAIVLMETAS